MSVSVDPDGHAITFDQDRDLLDVVCPGISRIHGSHPRKRGQSHAKSADIDDPLPLVAGVEEGIKISDGVQVTIAHQREHLDAVARLLEQLVRLRPLCIFGLHRVGIVARLCLGERHRLRDVGGVPQRHPFLIG